jgi:hypothetical protein
MMLIDAVAQDRPRKVNTKYGERVVIDAIRPDNGEKVTIWRGGDDEYSQRFVTRNSPITLTLDSKGKYNLVEKASTPLEPKQEKEIANPSKEEAIHSYVIEMADLFDFCLKAVDEHIETVETSVRRAIATTLFIQATKQFGI